MTRLPFVFGCFFVLLPFVASCSGESADADDATGEPSQEVTLRFRASVAGEPVDCATDYSGLGSGDSVVRLADARMFISGVELLNAAGKWTALQLIESDWQHDGIALLDFEDGSGACADSGTSEMNDLISGSLPEGEYSGMRFVVGIPFEHNHVDATTAPSPLNVPGMYWTWQGGYKFVRVDWSVSEGEVPRWNVHIGSTGCVSEAPTSPPAEACGRPNSARVELGDFDVSSQVVEIDLAALVATADLGANVMDTPPGCMSSPSETADCEAVFSAVGLSFETGECSDSCAIQSVFTAAEAPVD